MNISNSWRQQVKFSREILTKANKNKNAVLDSNRKDHGKNLIPLLARGREWKSQLNHSRIQNTIQQRSNFAHIFRDTATLIQIKRKAVKMKNIPAFVTHLLKYVSRRAGRKNAEAEVKQYGHPKHEGDHDSTNKLNMLQCRNTKSWCLTSNSCSTIPAGRSLF